LSLDEDNLFDRMVIRRMVSKRGKPISTDVPGFLYLEIDGLSEMLLCRAIDEGLAPTMKRWIDEGTHQVLGWETDFSSQTGAMQTVFYEITPIYPPLAGGIEKEKIAVSGLPNICTGDRARLTTEKVLSQTAPHAAICSLATQPKAC
jgi:hypothetical protein